MASAVAVFESSKCFIVQSCHCCLAVAEEMRLQSSIRYMQRLAMEYSRNNELDRE